jgi:hypothetical protein
MYTIENSAYFNFLGAFDGLLAFDIYGVQSEFASTCDMAKDVKQNFAAHHMLRFIVRLDIFALNVNVSLKSTVYSL